MTLLNDFDITVMGDSIAKGLFLKDNKIMRIERNTVKLMQEHYGVSIENFSLFGQTLKKTVPKRIFRYVSGKQRAQTQQSSGHRTRRQRLRL